jgi:hypothetical protein
MRTGPVVALDAVRTPAVRLTRLSAGPRGSWYTVGLCLGLGSGCRSGVSDERPRTARQPSSARPAVRRARDRRDAETTPGAGGARGASAAAVVVGVAGRHAVRRRRVTGLGIPCLPLVPPRATCWRSRFRFSPHACAAGRPRGSQACDRSRSDPRRCRGACGDGRAPAASSWDRGRARASRDGQSSTRALRSRQLGGARLRRRSASYRAPPDDLAALRRRDDLLAPLSPRHGTRARRRNRIGVPGGGPGGARRGGRDYRAHSSSQQRRALGLEGAGYANVDVRVGDGLWASRARTLRVRSRSRPLAPARPVRALRPASRREGGSCSRAERDGGGSSSSSSAPKGRPSGRRFPAASSRS